MWICPDPRGHLQATGRDARGRKQYRYHPRWREVRDETKYDRLIGFAQALPGDPAPDRTPTCARAGLPSEKVLAAVVQLLEKTLIRVGNDEYARQNRSFGLTTLRDGHVEVAGGERDVLVPRQERRRARGRSRRPPARARSSRPAAICRARSCSSIVDDDGQRQTIESSDVNDYLREITGEDFTSKDFRTWAGTVLAAQLLQRLRRVRLRGAGQAEHRPGDRVGRQAARQHQGGVPQVLHPPGDARRVHGWLDAGNAWPSARAAVAQSAAGCSQRRRPRCSGCCSAALARKTPPARQRPDASIAPLILMPPLVPFDPDRRAAAVHPRLRGSGGVDSRRLELQAVGIDAAVGDAGGDRRRRHPPAAAA